MPPVSVVRQSTIDLADDRCWHVLRIAQELRVAAGGLEKEQVERWGSG